MCEELESWNPQKCVLSFISFQNISHFIIISSIDTWSSVVIKNRLVCSTSEKKTKTWIVTTTRSIKQCSLSFFVLQIDVDSVGLQYQLKNRHVATVARPMNQSKSIIVKRIDLVFANVCQKFTKSLNISLFEKILNRLFRLENLIDFWQTWHGNTETSSTRWHALSSFEAFTPPRHESCQ